MNEKRNIIIPEDPDKPITPEPEKLQVSDFFNDAICDSSSFVIT